MGKKLKRFGSFLTKKIDFESQNFAHFDNFYSSGHKTLKLFNECLLVLGLKEGLKPFHVVGMIFLDVIVGQKFVMMFR